MRNSKNERNTTDMISWQQDVEEPIELETWEESGEYESGESWQNALDQATARHPSGYKEGRDDQPLPPSSPYSPDKE